MVSNTRGFVTGFRCFETGGPVSAFGFTETGGSVLAFGFTETGGSKQGGLFWGVCFGVFALFYVGICRNRGVETGGSVLGFRCFETGGVCLCSRGGRNSHRPN